MKSIVSYPNRGQGGNNNYRGNCSPKLIEDIIEQYNINSLNDYMVGGGTTEDVVRAKNLSGNFFDLNRGYDMLNMDIPVRAENIFWHPPYHDIITYSDNMYSAQQVMDQYGFDPRASDLSRCLSWDEFVKKMNYCCCKQFSSLDQGGRMFILMGDVKRQGKLYSMLKDICVTGTLEQIIIKAQHNCFSDRVSYKGTFVPIVHEYLMVVKKECSLTYPILCNITKQFDIRDSANATWRDVIAAVLEDAGRALTLQEIYGQIEGHKKCQNMHWKAKIRQTLQRYNEFSSNQRGVWKKVV